MQIKNIWNTLIEPSDVIVDVDQQRLARMFAIILLALAPVMLIVGIFILPITTGAQYLWQGDTFWPTIFALTCTLISYLLLRLGKYQFAVMIYIFNFICNPILTITIDFTPEFLPIASLAD